METTSKAPNNSDHQIEYQTYKANQIIDKVKEGIQKILAEQAMKRFFLIGPPKNESKIPLT